MPQPNRTSSKRGGVDAAAPTLPLPAEVAPPGDATSAGGPTLEELDAELVAEPKGSPVVVVEGLPPDFDPVKDALDAIRAALEQAQASNTPLELVCEPFEGNEIVTGIVQAVDAEGQAVTVRIPELGWLWPVKPSRIDLGRGEWTHVPEDYPEPGKDGAFDQAHRMSAAQRQALTDGIRANNEAEDVLRAEQAARRAAEAAEAERLAAAKPAAKRGGPTRGSVLAQLKGPGSYAGEWTRKRDGRKLDFAQPSDSLGYYPAATIRKFPELFILVDEGT